MLFIVQKKIHGNNHYQGHFGKWDNKLENASNRCKDDLLNKKVN